MKMQNYDITTGYRMYEPRYLRELIMQMKLLKEKLEEEGHMNNGQNYTQ